MAADKFLDDLINDFIQEALPQIYEQREEILKAFIAKYGCQPDEIVQVNTIGPDGVAKWWVEKKK